jgi:hypothetical protein
VQEWLNVVFNVMYSIELLLKVTAFGPRCFLQPVWNRFDAVLVLIGCLDLLVLFMPATSFRALRLIRIRRIFRLLRVLRLLRIFRGFQSLLHLINVLNTSLSGLWHVGTVVFFVFYLYAYLGVLLFGQVRTLNNTSGARA